MVGVDGLLLMLAGGAVMAAGLAAAGRMPVLRRLPQRAAEDEIAKAAPAAVARAAIHDVTGLPTREPFIAAIRADQRKGVGCGTLAVLRWSDYDRFAAFDAGAATDFLKGFARRLESLVASGRPLAQIGHDCFALWFAEADPASAAPELHALLYALSSDLETPRGLLVPTVSFGTASYPGDGAEPDHLILRARVSPADFEESGGSVTIRRAAEPATLAEDFEIEQRLRRAIDGNELELHYQPVIDAEAGRLVGAEALLRWTPASGAVPPARFVPLMERIGLADEIGTWVLNRACRDLSQWTFKGAAQLSVAVNVSHKQIANAQFDRIVAGTLGRYRLAPRRLELELTESAATHDLERTKCCFESLRAIGVRLVIDDFGTGYSSLSYLRQLCFDKLKIDREFVTDIDQRPGSEAICRSLVVLAGGLGIDILAEGAERAEEVQRLRELGCQLFQGYYFAKPLAAEAFADFARRRGWLETAPTRTAFAARKISA